MRVNWDLEVCEFHSYEMALESRELHAHEVVVHGCPEFGQFAKAGVPSMFVLLLQC